MSFKEKSLWVMFVGLVGAFGFYFANVLPAGSANVRPHQAAIFVVALVVLVITQIAGHVLIAIADRRTEGDERDRLIGLRGTRVGAFVLATGVFVNLEEHAKSIFYNPGDFRTRGIFNDVENGRSRVSSDLKTGGLYRVRF